MTTNTTSKRRGVRLPYWAFFLVLLLAFGAGAGAGVIGLLWGTGGFNSEPSRDTSDVVQQLSLDATDATPAPELAEINAKLDALATQIASISVVAPPATDGDTQAEEAPAAADVPSRALYRIAERENSFARFRIGEEFSGTQIEVVGETQRVAGDIIVNFAEPTASQVGQIAINARTFKTDQSERDAAINSLILQSVRDENEFIFFQPTRLEGLPDAPVAVGERVAFDIVGDLTIRGETREATFNAEVVVVDDETLTGFASTQVAYADFGITINPPPFIANIGEIVTLEIEFAASKVDEQ